MEAALPRYLLVSCEGDLLGQGLVSFLRMRGTAGRVAWRPPAKVLSGTGAVPDCVLLLASPAWSRQQLVATVRALSLTGSAVVVVSVFARHGGADPVLAAGALAHLGTAESPDVLVAVLERALSALPARSAGRPMGATARAVGAAQPGPAGGVEANPDVAGPAGGVEANPDVAGPAGGVEANPDVAGPRPSLSVQEQRVLEFYLDGLTIAATARRMGISTHTVVTYLRRIRAKFAACGHPAPSAVDLYRAAINLGVLATSQTRARTG